MITKETSTNMDGLNDILSSPTRDAGSFDEAIRLGIPGIKNEEYKHSPVSKFLKKSLEKGGFSPATSKYVFDSFLSESNYLIKIVNGEVVEMPESLEEGLTIKEMTAPQLASDHASLNDPFQLLNRGRFTTGMYIEVKKGAEIKKPVQIIYGFDTEEAAQIGLPRVEINVQDGATLSVVEGFRFVGSHDSIVFPVVFSTVGRNARLYTTTLQMEGTEQVAVANAFVKQARDSYYHNVTISSRGKYIRNNHNITQEDENCETHLYGLTLTKDKDHIDHHTIVDHTKPNSYSNELYKGILDDHSTGVFNGRIYVRPNAQQTNAFQSNNNILLSDTAAIHTKPQLEIWADDVKCSHGCTSGQLDTEALFYLRARGLDEKQAKGLLLKAFAGEVLDNIRFESLQELVTEHVDSRL